MTTGMHSGGALIDPAFQEGSLTVSSFDALILVLGIYPKEIVMKGTW